MQPAAVAGTVSAGAGFLLGRALAALPAALPAARGKCAFSTLRCRVNAHSGALEDATCAFAASGDGANAHVACWETRANTHAASARRGHAPEGARRPERRAVI